MYKKILVALDGSKLSARVIPYVRQLAYGLKTPVELLHVNDSAGRAPPSPPVQGSDYLNHVAAALSGITDVKCASEVGDPAEVIIERASTEPETLVAMATHGYSGPKRWLLGSVAEKVLRAINRDVLLVRPADAGDAGDIQFKIILVPLDGSELAEKALPTVLQIAKRLDIEVQLVHVTKHIYTGPSDAFLPIFGAIPNLKQIWEEDKAAAKSYLNEKVEQLGVQGLAHVSFVVIEGGVDGAAAEIIDHAEKLSESLIAMTSHGRSGIGRWFMGSVAERVVRHARSPVFVIRSQA